MVDKDTIMQVICGLMLNPQYLSENDKYILMVDSNIDDRKFCMGDITVQDDNHRFYANGILSHNSTTTAIFCLWR